MELVIYLGMTGLVKKSGDSCRQCHRAVGNYEILGYGVLIP